MNSGSNSTASVGSNRAATASVSCRDSLISVTRKKPTSSSGRRTQSREGFYGSNSNGSSVSSNIIGPTSAVDSWALGNSDLEPVGAIPRNSSTLSIRSKTSVDCDSGTTTNHISLPDIGMSRSKSEKERTKQLLLKDDQEFIEKLKLKVEEQQLELEKSNGSLEQIQRNFEQLSAMYKSKFYKSLKREK